MIIDLPLMVVASQFLAPRPNRIRTTEFVSLPAARKSSRAVCQLEKTGPASEQFESLESMNPRGLEAGISCNRTP